MFVVAFKNVHISEWYTKVTHTYTWPVKYINLEKSSTQHEQHNDSPTRVRAGYVVVLYSLLQAKFHVVPLYLLL